MSIFSLILIGLWCILIGLDGGLAALHYDRGDTAGGIAWTVCAILWTAAIILRVVNPE